MSTMLWRRWGTCVLAAAMMTLLGTAAEASAARITGQWILEPSEQSGLYHLTIHRNERDNYQMTSSTVVERAALRGLDPATASGPVKFSLVREAGSLECEGYLRDRKGAGHFSFIPDAGYAAALGLGPIDEEDQFRLAICDVTVQYVREMKKLGLGSTVQDFKRMKMHDVTPEFVRSMASVGYTGLSVDELVRMQNHDVNAQFVREMTAEGIANLTTDELVRLKNHDVTAASIREWRALGFPSITTDEIIRFNNHDVTPEYVTSIRALGYSPDPDDLVRMMNHEVTVEYIRSLADKGMKNLQLDDIIRLRKIEH